MSAEIIPGVPYHEFVHAAKGCATEAEFRSSAFYRQHGESLERLLDTPRIVERPDARPPQHSPDRFRIVHWNIEKGKQLSRIVERLRNDPILADADVYSFNEVDVGMARSGNNADVAQVLADALQCHHAFVPSYLECTKGPGDESLAPGENTRGWHGLAIMSRFPIESARVLPLPSCFDYYDFFEKRYGRRQGLVVRIRWRGHLVEVISTHLEVRNTPQCRARQMNALLEGLEHELPQVIAGDFNTNSFRRGSMVRSAREFARIVASSPEALDRELREPYAREPLFALLERRGFSFRDLSDGQPTAEQILGSAEDLEMLPPTVGSWLSRTFGLGTRVLRMRLDWIAAREWMPLEARTHAARTPDGPASDHAAIHADLELE
jgi:endonuclease/exonuclease/phosphatase family metal-dependent hydrolase